MDIVERLKKALQYNSDTGIFSKESDKKAACGYIRSDGYRIICISKSLYFAHRLAWLYIYGDWPEGHIDHIDHNRDNNSIDNLRCVTRQDNQKNKKKYKNNKTGITGVIWNDNHKRWIAKITSSGKIMHLGSFKGKFEACCARKSAERKHNFHSGHGL